ncbi:MAG: hypothetical protein ABJG78_15850 [Cyclobacteriaceae bacterium]
MDELDKGIWIDETQAWIVYKKYKQINLKSVGSVVEPYHLRGGSRSSTPWGPQETVSETGLLRRKKQQLRTYFRRVIQELLPAKRVYIMGPAEAKIGLQKELEQMKSLSFKSMVVETADSMTQNQFKAKVKEFFAE